MVRLSAKDAGQLAGVGPDLGEPCKVVGYSKRGPELLWNDNSVLPHISLILLYVLRIC